MHEIDLCNTLFIYTHYIAFRLILAAPVLVPRRGDEETEREKNSDVGPFLLLDEAMVTWELPWRVGRTKIVELV